jgi:hypothetical protein
MVNIEYYGTQNYLYNMPEFYGFSTFNMKLNDMENKNT